MLGEAVAEVILTLDLVDRDPAASHLILEPQLVELHVPDFSKSASTRYPLSCAGVCEQIDTSIHHDILQHAAQAQRVARALHHAVVLRLA